MKYTLSVLVGTVALAAARNFPRASSAVATGEAKEQQVCQPTGTSSSGVTPPCQEIANIESACQPNGTEPIDYEAHAQCMCNGSYFNDWVGCQKCLEVHGLRSERDTYHYVSVLSQASKGLCTGTPTAAFSDYFASAGSVVPPATSGNTVSSDEYPGKTDVSLYYTPSGTQGPGAITGSAASATHRAGATPPGAESAATTTTPSTTTALGPEDHQPPKAATSSGSGSSTSNAAAQPTQHAGLAMVIAGAALMAI